MLHRGGLWCKVNTLLSCLWSFWFVLSPQQLSTTEPDDSSDNVPTLYTSESFPFVRSIPIPLDEELDLHLKEFRTNANLLLLCSDCLPISLLRFGRCPSLRFAFIKFIHFLLRIRITIIVRINWGMLSGHCGQVLGDLSPSSNHEKTWYYIHHHPLYNWIIKQLANMLLANNSNPVEKRISSFTNLHHSGL